MIQLQTKNCNTILTAKHWKKLALVSEKIDKYESFTGEEILPRDQKRLIEKANFAYSPLGKALEKQTESIEDKGEKQIKAIEEDRKQLINLAVKKILKNIWD